MESIFQIKHNFWLKQIPYPIKQFLGRRKIKKWIAGGRVPPPPKEYKHQVILNFAQKHNHKIFIETGTYMGETLYMMKNFFNELYSIELSDFFYGRAVRTFKSISNISLIHGDSGKQLKLLLKEINSSALFWLDAHYSGGKTAKGKLETPVITEIESIFSHNLKHTILIDDARDFIGKNDYPTMKQLRNIIEKTQKYNHFEVKNDIIRIW